LQSEALPHKRCSFEGADSTGSWKKIDSYQGIASAMPQLLQNKSRLRRYWPQYFFNTRLHPFGVMRGNAGAAEKGCEKSRFLAIKCGLSG